MTLTNAMLKTNQIDDFPLCKKCIFITHIYWQLSYMAAMVMIIIKNSHYKNRLDTNALEATSQGTVTLSVEWWIHSLLAICNY